MEALSTIGYEGAAMEDLLATLRREYVDLLLDVREAPISRRPGFAKKALATALAEAGIDYRHEGALGAPKPLRDRIKQGQCTSEEFFAGYTEHLSGERQQALLDRLPGELDGHIALLCYERDVRECHRREVVRALEARTGISARYLIPGSDGGQLGLEL